MYFSVQFPFMRAKSANGKQPNKQENKNRRWWIITAMHKSHHYNVYCCSFFVDKKLENILSSFIEIWHSKMRIIRTENIDHDSIMYIVHCTMYTFFSFLCHSEIQIEIEWYCSFNWNLSQCKIASDFRYCSEILIFSD